MEAKYKIGDTFTRKNTRDEIPLEIVQITYMPTEVVYRLEPIRLCGGYLEYGETALEELFNKITK